jgi:para-aminobenzoate synthetase
VIRTLLIDNHDSFTWNLVHDLTRVNGVRPVVVPNDWPGWAAQGPDLLDRFDNVVISPGPGTPENPADVGIGPDVIRAAVDRSTPVLGICLGHQLIAHLYGARVVPAREPVHGRISQVRHDGRGLLHNIPSPFDVVRYHSLAVTDVPPAVHVEARTDDGEIMALSVPGTLLWGVQFHPESVQTTYGPELLANFAQLTRDHGRVRKIRDQVVPLAGVADTRAFAADLFGDIAAGARHAVWLDGNRADDPRARFSVMGAADGEHAGPSAAVLTADEAAGTVTVTRGGQSSTVSGGVLDVLADDLARWNIRGGDLAEDLAATPPFAFRLGWVGYLGYGVTAECLPGERPATGTTPGAPDSAPDAAPDAAFVFLDRAVVIDHELGQAHLLMLDRPRERDTGPWATAEGTRWQVTTAARVRELADRSGTVPDATPAAPVLTTTLHDRAPYLDKVRAAQALIRAGETYEVCLTTTLESTASAPTGPAETLALYRDLRRENPAPFGAYLRLPGATVLSTSPERFLSVGADGRMTSSPIKGTRPRDPDEIEDARLRADLADSGKDRAENLMIVDLVRHDLGRVAEDGTVQVPDLFGIESYATTHQMVSTVTARLAPGRTAVDAVRSAFPPGSMTGAPKERTVRILARLEDRPRGVYSGALGYFSLDGAVDLSVVIRTLVVEDTGRISYGVGGAVVAQSDPDAEYDETVVKAAPLLRRGPN